MEALNAPWTSRATWSAPSRVTVPTAYWGKVGEQMWLRRGIRERRGRGDERGNGEEMRER